MLFISNTCLAPLSLWSCRIASITCSTSTIAVCCILASRTASLSTFPACSLSEMASGVVFANVLSLFMTFSSSWFLTSVWLIFIRMSKSVRTFPFSLRMPSSRCSGFTEAQARRIASSLLNERTSDTLGENWFVICTSYVFYMKFKLRLSVACPL